MNGYSPIYIQEKGVRNLSADSLGIYPVLWANYLRFFFQFSEKNAFLNVISQVDRCMVSLESIILGIQG